MKKLLFVLLVLVGGALFMMLGALVSNTLSKPRNDSLFVATAKNNVAEARRLIEAGADVNARDGSDYNFTPLMYAAINNSDDVAKLLLKAGADIEAKDYYDCTPILHAALWESTEVTMLLIDAGANVNAMNKAGDTPLIHASREKATDVVRLLLDAGANVNAKNNDGKTALMVANEEKATAIVKMLEDAVHIAPVFADSDDFLEINVNAKVSTRVYLPSKNQKYSLEWAIEDAMLTASVWNDGDYTVNIYKNTKELLSSADFKDDYIYGSALTAVTNLHYGMTEISYYGYDDEYENLFMDWDFLTLYALDDGRFMCVKVLDMEVETENFEKFSDKFNLEE